MSYGIQENRAAAEGVGAGWWLLSEGGDLPWVDKERMR
jgi:hypothetical protein